LDILSIFWVIFSTVILPIFLQICIGFAIQRKLKFDLRTLSQIQLYVMVPAMLFIKIYQSDVAGDIVSKVILSTIVIYVILVALGFLVAWICRFKNGMRNAFANSVSMYNSGNYCIPLMQLLFNGDPFVMSVQAIVMTTQNIIVSTVGALMASAGTSGIKDALKSVLKIPMIYVAVIAVIFKLFEVPVWTPVVSTIDIISTGLVPVALFTLGAQLAEVKMSFSDYRIYISNFIKLVIAPVVAFITIMIFGITGIPAQIVMIVTAAPTAVNVLILSMQYNNEPEYTSKAVFSSTVLSCITVTAVIYISQLVFG